MAPGTPTCDFYLPTLLIANVCSLASKIVELGIVAQVNDVDFICLTESWLSQSIPDTTLSLSNSIQKNLMMGMYAYILY